MPHWFSILKYKLHNLNMGHFNVNFRHCNIVSGGKGVDEDTTRQNGSGDYCTHLD